MTGASTPVELFCSYAHEDEMWRQKLETHLSLLKRQGLISFWHDRLIAPGADWAKTIDAHLETASVILLLVSADFLASDYCYGVEMKLALERQESGEARLVPILVRPVDWTGAPFAYLQSLPTDAIPLASWRNKEAGLADVAAGIRRVIVEELPQLSASAPRAALPAIWNIPYPRNPFFLGRENELAQVRHHLQAGRTTALSQPQAISGLGGIGKTQLALEYAYRYHQDYQAVLWARAENTEALVSSYVALATLLRLPERESKEQEAIVQAVKTWLQTHQGWLLILDNADELTLLPDFLPPILGGHLLLTTRAAATRRLARQLEIGTLLPEQGAVLLLRRAGLLAPDAELSQASQEERELAIEISQELGGLPLALDQAGAYLEETGMALADYWQLYEQHRANLLRKRGGLVADHPSSVATTWSMSFQRVGEQNPAAADLLRLLAFLAPEAIPEEILTASATQLGEILAPVAAEPLLFNQAIEALRAYSLVHRDPMRRTLSIHRLVQAVLRDGQPLVMRKQWMQRAVLAVNETWSSTSPDNWETASERYLPHALLCATWIEQEHMTFPEAATLLILAGEYLRQYAARYTEAEPLLQSALVIREKIFGSEHLLVAEALEDLANLYEHQGKDIQAEPLWKRALGIREQYMDTEHLDATSLYNLTKVAWFYRIRGKYTRAESLYERALAFYEQNGDANYARIATCANGLAFIYEDQGKFVQAEPLYQRALAIYEQRSDASHPKEVYLQNLGRLYIHLGQYEQAEALLKRALAGREQLYGLEHPYTISILNYLVLLYQKRGQYEQAEALLKRTLASLEQQLGFEHLDTAQTMYDFARLWESLGNNEEARAWYSRALAIREQALGAHHPNTIETRTHLIAVLHALGQHEEAAQLEMAQSES